ncbi:MAG TPA: pyridoxine 5'-phosphate synthase [Catalimonadaceae bacterium]|nr:pyridoxine 5'-phosphate synthase [Catalimonadaceae bacterium]
MTRLSVNINKIATLRNSRGGNNPDLIHVAVDCEAFGAQGITVHPRPDERHIRYEDVRRLKKHVTTEFNIEGYPDKRFLDLVFEVVPHQLTLVPDAPDALTSNTGWDTETHFDFLKEVVEAAQALGIRVSLFIDPIKKRIYKAADLGADRIELYTGPYAELYRENPAQAVHPFVEAGIWAQDAHLGLNAGHDLSLENLAYFAQKVPHLKEVSIGHALICDSLYYGLNNTIQMYRRQLGH